MRASNVRFFLPVFVSFGNWADFISGSSVKARNAAVLCWSCCVLLCVLIFSYFVLSLLCISWAVFLFLSPPLLCSSFLAGASYHYSSSGHSANSLCAQYSLFCAELVTGSRPNRGISSCSSRRLILPLSWYICQL